VNSTVAAWRHTHANTWHRAVTRRTTAYLAAVALLHRLSNWATPPHRAVTFVGRGRLEGGQTATGAKRYAPATATPATYFRLDGNTIQASACRRTATCITSITILPTSLGSLAEDDRWLHDTVVPAGLRTLPALPSRATHIRIPSTTFNPWLAAWLSPFFAASDSIGLPHLPAAPGIAHTHSHCALALPPPHCHTLPHTRTHTPAPRTCWQLPCPMGATSFMPVRHTAPAPTFQNNGPPRAGAVFCRILPGPHMPPLHPTWHHPSIPTTQCTSNVSFSVAPHKTSYHVSGKASFPSIGASPGFLRTRHAFPPYAVLAVYFMDWTYLPFHSSPWV